MYSSCLLFYFLAILERTNQDYLNGKTKLQTMANEKSLMEEKLRTVEEKRRTAESDCKTLRGKIYIVNSEIFARVLFSRNFACACAKFRDNQTLVKCQNHSVVY